MHLTLNSDQFTAVTRLFVITELSILSLFVHALLRHDVLILGIEPLLPFTRGILGRVVDWLVRSGRAGWAIDTVPDLRRVRNVPRRTLLYDIFGQIEFWQNTYFRFADAERTSGDYALAYKQAVTNYVTQKHVQLLAARALLGRSAEKLWIGIGVPDDTRSAITEFCGKPLTCRPDRTPVRLINFALFASGMLASLVWIMRHVCFVGLRSTPVFVAADFIADPRDMRLYRELEEGGRMLMVKRGDSGSSPMVLELSDYVFCDRSDGHVSVTDIIPTVNMVIADQWRFFRHFNRVHPALYRRLLSLPYQRMLYRGLFSRYRPKFFWGRDPYNEDHIIRRQELNRVGGKSFGVNTGALTWAILIPETRYVSYDRYYVFGRGKYKKYYGDTWAKHMEIVPAGSFTTARRHYAHRFDPRPPDIAVFASVLVGEPEVTALVRGLSAAFPERKIILQVKSNFYNLQEGRAFVDRCREGLANVVYTSDSVYDVFLRARYGFSDPSSVVLEAMQFGMISFAIDLPHVQVTNVNREYPGLCVETVDQAIIRIRDIESGTWRYPIETFQDVVDMSGVVFFDRVRRDMGLCPRETNIPLLEASRGTSH